VRARQAFAERQRAAIEQRRYSDVSPFVQASNATFKSLKVMALDYWRLDVHEAFIGLPASVAHKLKPVYERSLQAQAKALGADTGGLRLFFETHFKELTSPPSRTSVVPCFADLVLLGKRPVWVVVCNWESDYEDPDDLGDEALFGTLCHIMIFCVDATSGDILHTEQCG